MRALLWPVDGDDRLIAGGRAGGCGMQGDLACRTGLTAGKNKPPAGGLSVLAIWPQSGVLPLSRSWHPRGRGGS